MQPTDPFVLARDARSGDWLLFEQPDEVFETGDSAGVLHCLRSVEAAVEARGLWAAGAVAYEAAPAFDPSLAVRPASPRLPLLWFGLFPPPRRVALPPPTPPAPLAWRPSVTADAYREAFDRIKHHIREGDTYQVNFTFRLTVEIRDQRPDAEGLNHPLLPTPLSALLPLFSRLTAAQGAAYSVLIATRSWALLSASPELFFSLDGRRLVSRPMKGTAARGHTPDVDRARAADLLASEKNRAENVMIVDMVRNDIGRVAEPGTVNAPELFTLEKYPTLWQLTSTVQARSDASVSEIFAALFPAASITGAPKSSAMRIIAENECGPRGFYTGAAGFIAPGRHAQFNVAIRSLQFDRIAGGAEYGTGGGIVWDSACEPEQCECIAKASILNADASPFSLLETLLWNPETGLWLLEKHLARLAASAEYFDIPADARVLRRRLAELTEHLPPQPHRVRLLVAQDGGATVEAAPFTPAAPGAPPLRVTLAARPIDKNDRFLYHKTTRRRVYEEALTSRPGFDDVILWNADGEVTESSRANLAAELEGRLYTPPIRCGLLPGTLRQHLLETGEIAERVLTPDDLRRASSLWLFNALRGRLPAVLCTDPDERR